MTLRGSPSLMARASGAVPAPIILIGAIILLQVGSGFAKSIMSVDNALSLAFLRIALGAVFLAMIVRPKVSTYSRAQWIDAGLLGMSFAFANASFYIAINFLPLGLATTIAFMGPIALSVVAARRPLDYLWPLLGFGGVLLLTPWDGTGTISWTAIGYGLANAVGWALYILAAARAGRSIPGLGGFTIATAFAALLLAPFGIAEAGFFFSTPTLMGMTLVVVLLAVFPLVLEFIALVRLQPRVFGVLLSLEPAIATITGMILLDERLNALGWLALIFVSAASIGVTFSRHPQGRRPRATPARD